MTNTRHLSIEELEAGLDEIRQAPKDSGLLQMIVRRPQADQREVLEEAFLHVDHGLLGDNWNPQKDAQRAMQITLMNARVIALLAGVEERWPLAGDQLYIDMDLSLDNLLAGRQLAVGTSVLEVSAIPHTGCKKFAQRFGKNAVKFVNSKLGQQLCLRGVNATVVQSGVVRVGDVARIVDHAK